LFESLFIVCCEHTIVITALWQWQ